MSSRFLVLILGLCAILSQSLGAQDDVNEESGFSWSDLPVELHGFVEARAGLRLQDDPYEKDASIGEGRLQLDVSSYPEWGDIVVKGDAVGDAVLEKGTFDLREANVALRPLEVMDLKIGRQILTWGTGDLIFINDMFPKDWRSFFIGRDTEYLKAPSDALKVSVFSDWGDFDLSYTPKFDPDRYITGERISYWNNNMGSIAGRNAIVATDEPDRAFQDDELALRGYKNLGGYELALYGYWGFWKSPGGFDPINNVAQFPRLYVYGASAQGTVGPGIGNAEIGYYDSAQDRNGTNPLINNSEMRYLLGYSQELARNFTGGLQYYLEQMLKYNSYKAGAGSGPARDEFRHVLTLRLTKLLLDQNLRLSLFGYYSPSDNDTYWRPIINYKASDNLALELGANLFAGQHDYTFFGQFHYNTNMYGAIRYSF
ncbi:hypothetical protein ACFL6U_06560 [Planctomycetota bacterium]